MHFSVEAWAPEYGIAADAEQFEDGSERVVAGPPRRVKRKRSGGGRRR